MKPRLADLIGATPSEILVLRLMRSFLKLDPSQRSKVTTIAEGLAAAGQSYHRSAVILASTATTSSSDCLVGRQHRGKADVRARYARRASPVNFLIGIGRPGRRLSARRRAANCGTTRLPPAFTRRAAYLCRASAARIVSPVYRGPSRQTGSSRRRAHTENPSANRSLQSLDLRRFSWPKTR
jgi:hypothetical protein